jgi:hypothetical protein
MDRGDLGLEGGRLLKLDKDRAQWQTLALAAVNHRIL